MQLLVYTVMFMKTIVPRDENNQSFTTEFTKIWLKSIERHWLFEKP